MRELSLFTGAGGGLLGSLILGWEPVQFVESDAYCRRILAARFPGVPVHEDVRTFHPEPRSCDVVTGGFPCQPFSQAGKRLGEDDPRFLWPDTHRVLVESGAGLAFLENVPGLLTVDRGRVFGRILADLATSGFRVRWCVLGADDVGAPHRRKRLWILAYRDAERQLQPGRLLGEVRGRTGDSGREVSDPEGGGRRARQRDDEAGEPDAAAWLSPWAFDPADLGDPRRRRDEPDGRPGEACGEAGATEGTVRQRQRRGDTAGGAGEAVRDASGSLQGALTGAEGRPYPDAAGNDDPWLSKPHVGRVAHGIPKRVDRLRGLGNAQVPQCMAAAFLYLAREAVSRPIHGSLPSG